MPYALILAGSLLLVSGVRGTQAELFALLKKDFTGPNNFAYWIVAIMAIGAVGYVPKLKPVSDSFLVLVIIVLFLHNKGFFAQFQRQLAESRTATPAPATGGSTNGLPPLPAMPEFDWSKFLRF